jgi:hypothetical protein
MKTITLYHFTVELVDEDFNSHSISTIFTGLTRHCRETKIGTSFSMDEMCGFKVINGIYMDSTFKIHSIQVDGIKYNNQISNTQLRDIYFALDKPKIKVFMLEIPNLP